MSFCERHKDRHTEACTDIECVWDKHKKTSLPSEADKICTRKGQVNEVYEPTSSNFTPNITVNMNDLKNVEKELYKLFRSTDALVLQTLDPPSDEENTSDDEQLPLPTMADAIKECNTLSVPSDLFNDHLKSVFTKDIIMQIEQETAGQASNQSWYTHRNGRITASVIPSIMHFRFTENPDNYILKRYLILVVQLIQQHCNLVGIMNL